MFINKRKMPLKRKGFTMVELLAVIGIIGVMAAVIGVALGGGNATASLGNGQRIASSIFKAARSLALLKQTETRVIIYNQGGSNTNHDSNKQWRYIGVVFWDEAQNEWLPHGNGTYLPEGVYFIPEDYPTGPLSFVHPDSLTGSSFNNSTYNYNGTDNSGSFTVGFPNIDGVKDKWFFYSFDKRGLSANPGGTFVIAAGEKDGPLDGNQLFSVKFENEFSVAGFGIRKLGGVTLFTDVDDIQ